MKLSTIKIILTFSLIFSGILTGYAQIQPGFNFQYSLSWYKTDCSESVGTSAEIRVNMLTFNSSQAYTCELYEKTGADPLGNPVNPVGSFVPTGPALEIVSLPVGFMDQTIDATFTTVPTYGKSYYVIIYPTNSPTTKTIKYISVYRFALPTNGTEYPTRPVTVEYFTEPHMCQSITEMDLVIFPTGGRYPYTYQWSNMLGTGNSLQGVDIYTDASQTTLAQYSVTITDRAGCAKVINNIEYKDPTNNNISVATQVFDKECLIQATIVNNVKQYGYEWYEVGSTSPTPISTKRTVHLEPDKSYYVEIYSNSGCLLDTKYFNTPSVINFAEGTLTGDPCYSGNVNQVTITALFGEAPYTYNLTGVNNAQCQTTVTGAASPVSISAVTCNGNTTQGIPVGCYMLGITDANGCSFSQEVRVGRNPNDIQYNVITEDAQCGANSGYIKIEPTGSYNGAGLFYNGWGGIGGTTGPDHGGNILELENVPTGTYNVTITETTATGGATCQKVETITIGNQGITLDNVYTMPACTTNQGKITLDLDLGLTNIDDVNFAWSGPNGYANGGGGLFEIDDLEAGFYTVIISSGLCEITETIEVFNNDLMIDQIIQEAYCDVTGSAVIKVMSGGMDISNQATYQWSTGANIDRIRDMPSGNYQVTVTYNNCVIVQPVTIPFKNLEFESTYKQDAFCGGANGVLNVLLPNNFDPWVPITTTFRWKGPNGIMPATNSTPPRFSEISLLPSGQYLVEVDVFDLNNNLVCQTSKVFQLDSVNPPLTYNIEKEDALCGGANGNATLDVLQASAPWWAQQPAKWTSQNTGNTIIGQSISDLAPSVYDLEVGYDIPYAACNFQDVVKIDSITPKVIQDLIQNPGCGGEGRITVSSNLDGTHHPFSYTLKDVNNGLILSQGSVNDFRNLSAGTYEITLNTDEPNCSDVVTITLEQSELRLVELKQAVCGQGGSIELALIDQNGNPITPSVPSDFVWEDGYVGNLRTGLAPGTYTVTVMQTNGQPCTSTYLITNEPLRIAATDIIHACDGINGIISMGCNDLNAVASFIAPDGTPVSNVLVTAIGGLRFPPGEYDFTITTSNNIDGSCVLYETITIYDGFDLSINTKDILCHGETTGELRAIVSNANAGIASYQWEKDGTPLVAYSDYLTNQDGGNYTVTVTDANGCTVSKPAVITEPALLQITIGSFQSTTNQCGATITFLGGTAPYIVDWAQIQYAADGTTEIGNITQKTTIATANGAVSETKLPPGEYIARITDANGCTVESDNVIDIQPTTTALPTMYFRWKKIAPTTTTSTPTTSALPNTTEVKVRTIADNMATQTKEVVEKLEDALLEQSCDKIDNIVDETTLEYPINYHHYTLYYYNRRGELVRTVPPAGVDLLDASEIAEHRTFRTDPDLSNGTPPSKQLPNHTMVTTYHYDAAGRNIATESPDGGAAQLRYRSDGLVRFSQDARQKEFATERFTYIKYDNLNRVIEQGEMEVPGGDFDAYMVSGAQGATDLNNQEFPLITNTTITEYVRTYYSVPHSVNSSPISYHGQAGQEQRYLRNRVSYTESWNGGTDVTTVTTCSYSYDPHGNVEWIRNYIPGLGDNYIRMEYDLVSGNVNKVCYNELVKDRFFHRYQYDEQNRIVNVETSRDDIIWDSDARYNYYEHGPLKRVEIGEDRIQGCDYTYTIHGWIKAMNHPYLDKYKNIHPGTNSDKQINDPGLDGMSLANNDNKSVLKDVWGFALGYYNGDYARITQNPVTGSTYNSIGQSITYTNSANTARGGRRDLYNGNIGYWANGSRQTIPTSLGGSNGLGDGEKLTQRDFKYDNLNRIQVSRLQVVDNGANPNNSPVFQSRDNRYKTTYNYDPNGNLTKLKRFDGEEDVIDQLTYEYTVGTNKLKELNDKAGIQMDTDIGDQEYEYDAKGNIIQITETDANKRTDITWLNTGKVKSVTIDQGNNGSAETTIEYLYDANGNRVAKNVIDLVNPENTITTYYVRDASGNTLSVYNKEYKEQNNGNFRTKFHIKEQLLYGSSRIGTLNPSNSDGELRNTRGFDNLAEAIGQELPIDYVGRQLASTSSFTLGNREIGRKEYTLSDHLGNVTVVLSDAKGGSIAGNNIKAKILQYQQYYPFGWNMPGRSKSVGEEYRFGFNTQEKSPEISSGHTTALFWEYDSRSVHRWNIDPVFEPHLSPYHINFGNPILNNDPNGDFPNPIKAVVTVFKAMKKSYKAWKKGDKFSIKDFVKDELADLIEDGSTVLDPNASFLERGTALLDIVSGLDLSKQSKNKRKKFKRFQEKAESHFDKQLGPIPLITEKRKKKKGPVTTKTKLPDKNVVSEGGVDIKHNYGNTGEWGLKEHGPVHFDVEYKGKKYDLMQSGKTFKKGDLEKGVKVPKKVTEVFRKNRSKLRRTERRIGKWYKQLPDGQKRTKSH